MTEKELNSILARIQAEIQAKYANLGILLKTSFSGKFYGLNLVISENEKEIERHMITFSDNVTETTLRRHIHNLVNKIVEGMKRKCMKRKRHT